MKLVIFLALCYLIIATHFADISFSSTSAPPQPVVKLIEEASLRGLKEVRFITLQNQYILNIREGFQQNAVFGFRRQIKKRPMFMSIVMLTPHLQ